LGFKHLLLVAGAATALCCGTGGPKVQPSPVPVIDDPVVSCPSDIAITTHNGAIPTITFDVPTADKGAPPVTVVCTPESGTEFANGLTTVTCEATDSRAHKGRCTFSVTVTPTPRLLKTTFLAFGDSQTEGKPSSVVGPAVVVVANDGANNVAHSYVDDLDLKLTNRYQDQAVKIIADGLGGELTGEDKFRMFRAVDTYKPDSLLLLEGANDILNYNDDRDIDSAAEALGKMVDYAKARNVRVFLATIPMSTGSKTNATKLAANAKLDERIRLLAKQKDVTLVDLAANLAPSAIGSDGVHLTASGYDLMADEWLKAIIDTMEVKPQ